MLRHLRPLVQPVALVLVFCLSIAFVILFPDQWWWVVLLIVMDVVVAAWLLPRVAGVWKVLPWERSRR